MVGTSRAPAVRGEHWVRGSGRGVVSPPPLPRPRHPFPAPSPPPGVARAARGTPRPPAPRGMSCVSAEALPLEVAFWHVSVLFVDAEDFAFLTLPSPPKLKKFGGFLSFIRSEVLCFRKLYLRISNLFFPPEVDFCDGKVLQYKGDLSWFDLKETLS